MRKSTVVAAVPQTILIPRIRRPIDHARNSRKSKPKCRPSHRAPLSGNASSASSPPDSSPMVPGKTCRHRRHRSNTHSLRQLSSYEIPVTQQQDRGHRLAIHRPSQQAMAAPLGRTPSEQQQFQCIEQFLPLQPGHQQQIRNLSLTNIKNLAMVLRLIANET